MFESKETILSVEAMLTVTISFMEDKESPPLNTITDGMQVPSEGSTCKAKYNYINRFNCVYLTIIDQLRFFDIWALFIILMPIHILFKLTET